MATVAVFPALKGITTIFNSIRIPIVYAVAVFPALKGITTISVHTLQERVF
jgi:hypothetical protein